MAAIWKGVKQTLVASFIFKRHFLDDYEGGIGFQDLAVKPVYIWWKNIFSIFTAVSADILWQRAFNFLPGDLQNIFQTCQITEDGHVSSQYSCFIILMLYFL